MVPVSSIRSAPLIVGWQEWVALPTLGLAAIKAKIDTGAKTSALHAETIEIAREGRLEVVHFTICPAPKRPDLLIACEAPLADLRGVTSSNGRLERRPVIHALVDCGSGAKRIEITLTDRGSMSYRMLIGRQALTALGLVVDPALSFQLPKLSFKLYPGWSRRRAGARA